MSADKTYPINYGLTRPPTASTPLWPNLLHPNRRTQTSTVDMASMAPPSAPLDKNATSMRVLLHDTQANFEKFGKHVGQLFDEIKKSKLEMKSIHSLFEKDRESLMSDIVDLVNRSQNEIQKSIGTPAQEKSVEDLFRDVNHRLSGLDQRLDALQSFNQTHSQALQTQIQAVQILLDKQATILAAVLPLLPLLQAIPLHIDTVKATLNEHLTKLEAPCKTPHYPSSEAAVQELPINKLEKRKRVETDKPPHSASTTPSMSTPSRKKIRTDKTSKISPSKNVVDSETADVDSSPIQRAPLTAIRSITTIAQVSSRRNESNATSIIGISPAQVADRNTLLSSGSRRGTFAIPALTTPRRPLGDLPVLSTRVTSNIHRSSSFLRPSGHEVSVERPNTPAPGFSAKNLTGITPTAARPPRILRVHTSFSNANNVDDTAAPLPNNLTTNVVGSSVLNRRPSHALAPFATTPVLQQQNLEVKKESIEDIRSLDAGTGGPLTLTSTGLEILSVKPKGVFGRPRRSPTREGRRFIPLVDSDDEEEDM